MTLWAPTQATKRQIVNLLDGLPSESLAMVEQFVRFLRYQKQPTMPEQAGFRYPSVPFPASSLDAWMGLLPEGYKGDALADTEALYDTTV